MSAKQCKDILWIYNRTTPNETTGCWEWKLSTESAPNLPYGRCYFGKRYRPAHRVVWELARGPIPPGMMVCHKCDNPRCCNPVHLFLGTAQDNATDRDAKNRTAKGDRNGARLHREKWAKGDAHWTRKRPASVLRGERSGRAKLDEPSVQAIRELRKSGATLQSLATEFGVGTSTISRVVRGLSW